jgi:hypothetical protein
MLNRDIKFLDKINHQPLPLALSGKHGFSTLHNPSKTAIPMNSNTHVDKPATNISVPLNSQSNKIKPKILINKDNKLIQSLHNESVQKVISYPATHHNKLKLPDIQPITEKLQNISNLSSEETHKSNL